MNYGLVLAAIAALLLPLTPAQRKPPADLARAAAAARQKDRQAAIQINNLAAHIHSLDDSRRLVNLIAEQFADDLPPDWATSGLRERIARAEYRAATSPANLVPEQRVADAWNRYVGEIGAPSDALVTVAEIHNMRDADCTAARLMWAQGLKEVWTVPNIYALGPDGKLAHGSRPLEAFLVVWRMANYPEDIAAARKRVKLGVLESDFFKKQPKKPASSHVRSFVTASVRPENPFEAAERRYVSERGLADYTLVIDEMIGNLLPAR